MENVRRILQTFKKNVIKIKETSVIGKFQKING